jgi:integrase
MAGKQNQRRFGYVRRLPSRRYSASYRDPNGVRRFAPDTFASKPEAVDWLTVQESLMVRREWTDPDRGKVPFGPYATAWITERPGLRPRTVYLYRWTLAKHLEPSFGRVCLSEIDPAMVRRWRSRMLDKGLSVSMVAKAYRLLRAILNTAVDHDELIRRNPCRIAGAGSESPSERPVLTIAEVIDLAHRVPDRFRAMVLVATFGTLRYGEASGLQRSDLDLDAGTLSVRHSLTEIRGTGLVLGLPKSRAGLRTVSLPAIVVEELKRHLSMYVDPDPSAFVFTGPKGKPIRRGNFNPLVGWAEIVESMGKVGLHFHDLRHTGNTLAAQSGASTRDLMARMGHDSMNAAIIYQHATRQADNAIAKALDVQLRAGGEPDDDPHKGARMPGFRRDDRSMIVRGLGTM